MDDDNICCALPRQSFTDLIKDVNGFEKNNEKQLPQNTAQSNWNDSLLSFFKDKTKYGLSYILHAYS